MLKVTKVWFNKYESGNLLGFARVEMSLDGSNQTHMIWNDIKLFKSSDGSGNPWIGLPTRKDEKGAVDENGKPKYYSIITLNKSESKDGPGDNLMEHIRQEVVKAYKNGGAQKKQQPKKTESDTTPPDDGVPF